MAVFFIHGLFYVLPNPLNRITAATDNTQRFGLSNLRYDKNGNITHLTRGGHLKEMPDWDKDDDFGTMDQLDYQYFDGSNRLRSVTDGILKNDTSGKGEFVDGNKDGDDYVYDPNGNMTQDLNKGIKGTTPTEKGIEYNHLNLPTLVRVNNGADVGTFSYIYDATGVKLRKNVLKNGSNTPTDYAGNYIYESGKLQFFNQPEGYVEPKNPDNLNQGYDYIYQYSDHLGNVRLSYKDNNGTTEILSENNYYPFGLEHKGYNSNVNGVENNYFNYNGKELEKSLGLEWLDYGWRNYDPTIGRWMNIDNLAGMMKSYSPYSYALNNPVYYIDIDGLMPGGGSNYIADYYRGPDRTVYWHPDVDENTILPYGYEYIGPTYYDEASRTIWGEDGKPMRLNAIPLDGFTGTPSTNSDSSNAEEDKAGNITSFGVGTEDRGRKGPRQGELNYNDFGTPGSSSTGQAWLRFLKWWNGIFTRGNKLANETKSNKSTMEKQPEAEPSVEGDTLLRIYPDPILTTRTKNPMGASVRGYILKDTVFKNTEENVKKVNELSSKRINDYDR